MNDIFDFIIVGAGSAGCVLADRLSANGRFTVLVLESGPHHDRFLVRMPMGYGRLFHDSRINWSYYTEPDPGLNGRSDYWPRGKVLGGSGAINAMVYVRGQSEDFDEWARMGNVGWSYSDLLPYFKKSEDNDAGADEFHQVGGQLKISGIRGKQHPIVDLALKSSAALGYRSNNDFNGATQEGFGLYQFNFRDGRRCSSANAFLEVAMVRPNVTVLTNTTATRVTFDGRMATGVEYLRDGVRHQARASAEVLLCGGSINSPALLQLSGVGPGPLLQRLGLDVVHHSPAVGANLQDHLQCGMAFKTTMQTYNNTFSSLTGQAIAGIQYLLARSGPLATSVNQGGGFFKTSEGATRPNAQLYIVPMSFSTNPSINRVQLKVDSFPAFTLNVSPCRPRSRGRLEIRSPEPTTAPAIHPNYYSDEEDIHVMIDCLKFVKRLSQTKPLADVIESRLRPAGELNSDEDFERHMRAASKTCFHPTSTCMMGIDPAQSVVAPNLSVHGMQRLRVIDASIMPFVISGNTNATAVMIGEKGADLVLQAHS